MSVANAVAPSGSYTLLKSVLKKGLSWPRTIPVKDMHRREPSMSTEFSLLVLLGLTRFLEWMRRRLMLQPHHER